MGIPDKMIIDNMNIIDLIPQRPPMVMIDDLIDSDEKKTVSNLFINEDNIFCEDGFFREPGLIENIAQTAAAGNGIKAKYEKSDVSTGYIGAIKNLRINFLPKANSTISTEVKIENEVLGVTIISGQIKYEGNIAAECEMKIFLINNQE